MLRRALRRLLTSCTRVCDHRSTALPSMPPALRVVMLSSISNSSSCAFVWRSRTSWLSSFTSPGQYEDAHLHGDEHRDEQGQQRVGHGDRDQVDDDQQAVEDRGDRGEAQHLDKDVAGANPQGEVAGVAHGEEVVGQVGHVAHDAEGEPFLDDGLSSGHLEGARQVQREVEADEPGQDQPDRPHASGRPAAEDVLHQESGGERQGQFEGHESGGSRQEKGQLLSPGQERAQPVPGAAGRAATSASAGGVQRRVELESHTGEGLGDRGHAEPARPNAGSTTSTWSRPALSRTTK